MLIKQLQMFLHVEHDGVLYKLFVFKFWILFSTKITKWNQFWWVSPPYSQV